MSWEHIRIYLMHYYPPSKGARVVVTSLREGREHYVVRSASHEGMIVDDPNIQSFLAWATDYYHGAPVKEVTEEEAHCAELTATPKAKRGRRPSRADTD